MSYPLVLTQEEIFCLRVMLKTVVGKYIVTAAHDFVEATRDPQPHDSPGVDQEMFFTTRVMRWYSTLQELEMPLLQASLLHPGQTVILSLKKETFEALRGVSEYKFRHTPGDTGTEELTARIVAAQQAIQTAMGAAEEQFQRASITPNIPLAAGKN